jgi:hypothetical protein
LPFVVCIVFYPTLLLRQSIRGREEIIISLEVYIVYQLRSCLYYTFGIVVFELF